MCVYIYIYTHVHAPFQCSCMSLYRETTALKRYIIFTCKWMSHIHAGVRPLNQCYESAFHAGLVKPHVDPASGRSLTCASSKLPLGRP